MAARGSHGEPTIGNKSSFVNSGPAARRMLIPEIKDDRGQTKESLISQKREGCKMKMLKILFVLFCLLAYAWAFSRPVQAQVFQTLYGSHPTGAAAEDTRPFKALVERTSPLFADRQMTLKIADVPAGQQVTVLETYNTNRHNRSLTLLVAYTGKDGKDRMGWFYGTLHVNYPDKQSVPLASR
jgi:hypothetical protein